MIISIDPSPTHSGIIMLSQRELSYLYLEINKRKNEDKIRVETVRYIENSSNLIFSKVIIPEHVYYTNKMNSFHIFNMKDLLDETIKNINTFLQNNEDDKSDLVILIEDYSYSSVTNNIVQTACMSENLKLSLSQKTKKIFSVPISAWRSILYRNLNTTKRINDEIEYLSILSRKDSKLLNIINILKKNKFKKQVLLDLISAAGIYVSYLIEPESINRTFVY